MNRYGRNQDCGWRLLPGVGHRGGCRCDCPVCSGSLHVGRKNGRRCGGGGGLCCGRGSIVAARRRSNGLRPPLRPPGGDGRGSTKLSRKLGRDELGRHGLAGGRLRRGRLDWPQAGGTVPNNTVGRRRNVRIGVGRHHNLRVGVGRRHGVLVGAGRRRNARTAVAHRHLCCASVGHVCGRGGEVTAAGRRRREGRRVRSAARLPGCGLVGCAGCGLGGGLGGCLSGRLANSPVHSVPSGTGLNAGFGLNVGAGLGRGAVACCALDIVENRVEGRRFRTGVSGPRVQSLPGCLGGRRRGQ